MTLPGQSCSEVEQQDERPEFVFCELCWRQYGWADKCIWDEDGDDDEDES